MEEDARRHRARERWRRAAQMAREQLFEVDPLASEDLVSRPSEIVLRHRWMNGRWEVDVATLKVSAEPFAEGSMRLCYYAKKLSSRVTMRHIRSGSKHAEWAYQRNYVLKTYQEHKVSSSHRSMRRLLEDDVITQAESKALARRYNAVLTALLAAGKFDRRTPKPMKYKCVDILEACLVVFPDRAGEPCFLMEAHVPGDFRKHNNNFGFVSGIVDEGDWRATPQAFSHFTFCASGGDRLVVDVQGVGDMYTDPQIHSRDGMRFGVGNGGPRGMALFFATHMCNRICRCMQLAPFAARSLSASAPQPGSPDADDWTLLSRLEAALDDYDIDCAVPLSSDPRQLGRVLPPAVAEALVAIAEKSSKDRWKDAPASSCRVLRDVHKTLGFMLLNNDDAIKQVASTAGALYHLSAAALGRESSALHFATRALEAYRDTEDRRALRSKKTRHVSSLPTHTLILEHTPRPVYAGPTCQASCRSCSAGRRTSKYCIRCAAAALAHHLIAHGPIARSRIVLPCRSGKRLA